MVRTALLISVSLCSALALIYSVDIKIVRRAFQLAHLDQYADPILGLHTNADSEEWRYNGALVDIALKCDGVPVTVLASFKFDVRTNRGVAGFVFDDGSSATASPGNEFKLAHCTRAEIKMSPSLHAGSVAIASWSESDLQTRGGLRFSKIVHFTGTDGYDHYVIEKTSAVEAIPTSLQLPISSDFLARNALDKFSGWMMIELAFGPKRLALSSDVVPYPAKLTSVIILAGNSTFTSSNIEPPKGSENKRIEAEQTQSRPEVGYQLNHHFEITDPDLSSEQNLLLATASLVLGLALSMLAAGGRSSKP